MNLEGMSFPAGIGDDETAVWDALIPGVKAAEQDRLAWRPPTNEAVLHTATISFFHRSIAELVVSEFASIV
jgi:hypothetical protein